MSINSGPRLPRTGLVLSLDVLKTQDWNLAKEQWLDASTRKNHAQINGVEAGLTLNNTEGYFEFSLNNATAEIETESQDFFFNQGDFSIEAWVYPTSFFNEIQIFTFDDANTGTLKINTAGLIQFSSSSYNTATDINNWTATLNSWNHIFLVRKNNVAYAYLNGILIGISALFNNSFNSGSVYIRKSESQGGVRIRTIRVWNNAVSDENIKLIYQSFNTRSYTPVTQVGLIAITNIATQQYTISENFSYQPVRAAEGAGGYVYLINPALPASVALNSETGIISGAGSVISDVIYTMTITDRILSQTTTTFNLEILPRPLTVTVPQPNIVFGTNTSVSIQPVIASQGFGNYTYSISPSLPTSSQPPSLTLDVNTGIIIGIPTGYVLDQNYTVTVIDEASQTAQGVFNLVIEPQPLRASTAVPIIEAAAGVVISSTPVSATGGETPITYSISPSLPSGLSINSATGNITGTPSSALAETTFTITVTDNVSQTASSTFILSVSAGLYQFTQFTFTNGSVTGNLGPTLTQLLTSYNTVVNPWVNNTSFFNVVSGIQFWTVPSDGTYRIVAAGATGGGGAGGARAELSGDFSLTQGEIIRILAGQQGLTQPNESNSVSGGGGTYVVRSPFSNTSAVLLAAGGGGASPAGTLASRNASLTTTGNSGGGGSSAGTGGTSGGGGAATNRAGAGGGFLTNGASSTQTAAAAEGGFAYVNGGEGGDHNRSGIEGGFGAGGAAWQTGFRGAGGGGGFSGGGSASVNSSTNSAICGGGGGSFISATATNTASVLNTDIGHGFITIIKV